MVSFGKLVTGVSCMQAQESFFSSWEHQLSLSELGQCPGASMLHRAGAVKSRSLRACPARSIIVHGNPLQFESMAVHCNPLHSYWYKLQPYGSLCCQASPFLTICIHHHQSEATPSMSMGRHCSPSLYCIQGCPSASITVDKQHQEPIQFHYRITHSM